MSDDTVQYQNAAPPGPSDKWIDRHEYDGPIPRPFEVWREDTGWCSACLVDDVPIVRFGTRVRCVGICSVCIKRIAGPDPRVEAAESERDALRARVAELEASLGSVVTRLRDVADHCLGLQPADAPPVDLLDELESRFGQERVAARQAEARVAELEAKLARLTNGQGMLAELESMNERLAAARKLVDDGRAVALEKRVAELERELRMYTERFEARRIDGVRTIFLYCVTCGADMACPRGREAAPLEHRDGCPLRRA